MSVQLGRAVDVAASAASTCSMKSLAIEPARKVEALKLVRISIIKRHYNGSH